MTAVFGAIVLAAGSARRFGGDKLSAPWRGRPLVAWAAAAALAATDGGPVVVVVGERSAAVAAALTPLADAQLNLVFAPDHALGLAHSLRTGLGALPPDLAGVFVFLGDMPRIDDETPWLLRAALAAGAAAAAPQFGGRRGHPVLFGPALWPQLGELSGDHGAGGLLDRLGSALALVRAPHDGVLFDVDTPDDLGKKGPP